MAVNAFTLFGEINVDTRKLQSALRSADDALRRTRQELASLQAATNSASSAETRHANSMRNSTREAQRLKTAIGNLGSSIRATGDSIKSFGSNLTMLVSVPLTTLGTAAFQSATSLDAIRNQLTAATGDMEKANAKFKEFIELARVSPGVFADQAAGLYAAFKPLGLTDAAINEVIKSFGRLKMATAQFDETSFRLNMAQLFTQNFELQDLKQATNYFPNFAAIVSKSLGLVTTDLDNLQKALKTLKASGKMSFEDFAMLIAQGVNTNDVYGKLRETLGNRFQKAVNEAFISLEKLGKAIAAVLLPALEKGVQILQMLAGEFEKLSPRMQLLIVVLGLVTAAIGPLAMIVGAAVVPFGILAGVILHLITAWPVLVSLAAGLGTALTAVGAAIGTVAGFLSTLGLPAIAGIIAAIIASLLSLSAVIVSVGAAAYAAYLGFKENMDKFWAVADEVVATLKIIWDDFTQFLATNLDPILTDLSKMWDEFGDDIKNVMLVVIPGIVKAGLAVILTLWKGIVQPILGVLGVLFRGISAIFVGILTFIGGIFQTLNAIVTGDSQKLADGAINIFKGLAMTIGGILLATVGTIIRGVIAFFESLIQVTLGFGARLFSTFRDTGSEASRGFAQGLLDNLPLINKIKGLMMSSPAGAAPTGEGGGLGGLVGDGLKSWEAKIEEFKKTLKEGVKIGGAGGGGRRGGGGGQVKQLSDYEQAVDRLSDSIARLNAVTNEQNILIDIAQGKIKGITDAQRTDLVQKAQLLDLLTTIKQANIELDAVNQSYTDTITALDAEIALLNATTEEERINLELLGKEYEKFTPRQITQIRLRKEHLAIIKAEREALKAQVQSQLDANNALLEFVNLNAPAKTNIEQLNFLLLTLKMRGIEVADALIKAATAAATAADQLKTKEAAFSNLTQLMQMLGMETENTKLKIQQLTEAMLNTAAMEQMAQQIGITVDELRARLQLEISEAENPTFGGQFKKKLQEMAMSTKDFTKNVADTLATSLYGIGDVFGQAVAEWDGTARGFFKSLGGAFQALIQQMIRELISLMIMRLLAGLGLAGAQGAQQTAGTTTSTTTDVYSLPSSSILRYRATGGLITGPGTGTSDSIPAMLSNGEFVIPARSVRKFGVDFFESLRKGQMPMRRYATGGMVMPSASAISNSTSNSTSNYNNVFNIAVPSGANAQQTQSMVQGQILRALRKHDARNK